MTLLGNASNILTVASSVYQVAGLINNFIQAGINGEIDSPEDFFNLLLGGGTDAADEEINRKLDELLVEMNALSGQITNLGTELQQQIDAQTGLIVSLDVSNIIASINSNRSQLASYDPKAEPGEPGYVSPADLGDYTRGFTERSDEFLQQLVGLGNTILTPTAGYTPNIDTVIAVTNAVAYAVDLRMQIAGRFERDELAAARLTNGLDAAAGFFDGVASFVPAALDVDISFEEQLSQDPNDPYPTLQLDVTGNGNLETVEYAWGYYESVISANIGSDPNYSFSTEGDPVATLQNASAENPLPSGSVVFPVGTNTYRAIINYGTLFVDASSVPLLPPILQYGIYDLGDPAAADFAATLLEQVVYYDLLEQLGVAVQDDGSQINAYSVFADAMRELTSGIEDRTPDADGNLTGTAGRDLLFGDAGDNLIEGLGDNDSLRGRGGDDTIYGGAGDDFIRGDADDDLIHGGTGNNRLYGGDGNDTIHADDSSLMEGGAGHDLLEAGASGSYTMFGGTGRDTLMGGTGDDVLSGDGGHDLIHGVAGSNWISGGNGNDTIHGGTGPDSIYGDAGDDMIYGGEGTGGDQLFGGNGNDTLVSLGGVNRLYGGSGNNVIQGDPISGFARFDTAVFDGNRTDYVFDVTLERIVLTGPDSQDTITGVEYFEFNDMTVDLQYSFFVAQFNAWVASGSAGDDILFGGDTDDFMVGDSGNDTILSGAGNDTIYGDSDFTQPDGADWIDGGNGHDLIYGGGANDTIFGGAGRDTIHGGAGDDLIHGGTSHDEIFGGRGQDTIKGGIGNDLLDGNAGDDRIFGDAGNDTILGRNGADDLRGGSGDDFLRGLRGDDTLRGQAGDDVLEGGINQDELYGGSGNDTLRGEDGQDLLYGGIDDDRLEGGSGSDVLYGEDGNDRLFGGDGRDFLYGGAGNDFLTGGLGNDVFVFADGFGNDRIFDFEATNDNEKIDLSAVTAITTYANLVNQRMSQSGNNVIIDDGLGNTIQVDGVQLADLDQNDFIF